MRRVAATRSPLATLAVVAALASGCGGDDDAAPADDPTTDPAVAALAEGIAAANAPAGDAPALVTDDEARCIAEALVDNPGVDRLTEVGALTATGEFAGPPQQAEEGVAAAWGAAHAVCLDLPAYVVGTVRVLADSVAEQPAGDAAWDEALACVRRDVPLDALRAFVAARASGAELASAPDDPFNACIGAAAGPLGEG